MANMAKKLTFILLHLTLVLGFSQNRYSRQLADLKSIENCEFNICGDTPRYPDNQVQRIVDEHEGIHSFFSGKVFDTSVRGVSVSTRDEEQLQTFCKTKDKTIRPTLMKDIQNIVRVIVNVGNYKQIIKFQVCENEGQVCLKERLLGYETKCEQKYNNIKLVTVDVTNNVLEYKQFKTPTTCVCTYRKTY